MPATDPPTPVVLHVLEAVGGGTIRHLDDLISGMTSCRHLVAMPTERSSHLSLHDAASGFRGQALVETVSMKRRKLSVTNLLAVARVARLAKRHDVSLIHAHSGVGGAIGTLAAALSRRPCVYTPHAVNPSLIARAVERALVPLRDVVIAVSPSEKEQLVRVGYRPDKVVTIVNGLGIQDDELPVHLDIAGNHEPLLGFVGRLDRQKGADLAIRSMPFVLERFPKAHLAIVGSGGMRSGLESLARKLDVSAVVSFHTLDQGASAAMGAFDVLLVPSRYEGGPYVPIEAMQRGIPVVLTDVVGNRDLADQGRCAVLVRPEDPSAIAAGVSQALDPQGRTVRVRAASERVATRHSRHRMLDATGALYRQLLDTRSVFENAAEHR